MTTPAQIIAVKGLEKQSQAFVRALWEMCQRNGWDPNAIAAIISIESGFNPRAHSPFTGQTAYGLLQWIESTQKALGTSRKELERLDAIGQLKYVEAFFRKYMPKVPEQPGDYYAVTYGRSDAIGKQDGYVLDSKKSTKPASVKRYELNSVLDADKDGSITIGDLRKVINKRLSGASGKLVVVPSDLQATGKPDGKSLGVYLARTALGGALLWQTL